MCGYFFDHLCFLGLLSLCPRHGVVHSWCSLVASRETGCGLGRSHPEIAARGMWDWQVLLSGGGQALL